jgi:hypothetical protein
MAAALKFFFRIPSAAASARARSRAVSTHAAPQEANPSAMARPIPRLPPMTTAVFPERSKFSNDFLFPKIYRYEKISRLDMRSKRK